MHHVHRGMYIRDDDLNRLFASYMRTAAYHCGPFIAPISEYDASTTLYTVTFHSIFSRLSSDYFWKVGKKWLNTLFFIIRDKEPNTVVRRHREIEEIKKDREAKTTLPRSLSHVFPKALSGFYEGHCTLLSPQLPPGASRVTLLRLLSPPLMKYQ